MAFIMDMNMVSQEILSLVFNDERDLAAVVKTVDTCKTFLELEDFDFE